MTTTFFQPTQSRRPLFFIAVLIMHVLCLRLLLGNMSKETTRPVSTMQTFFLKHEFVKQAPRSPVVVTKKTPAIAPKLAQSPSPLKQNQASIPSIAPPSEIPISTATSAINRDIHAITKNLERDILNDKEIERLNKKPNQIVSERWAKEQKQHLEEESGVVGEKGSGSYNLPDGSRITKVNGKCYKAPDPGREYLHQSSVRRVFCTR
jgi:hypothetical protein